MNSIKCFLFVGLLSGLAQANVKRSCPEYEEDIESTEKYNCVCKNDQTPRAECVNRSLDSIPHDLDPSLDSLDVSYNKITQLDSLPYEEITKLNLSFNNIMSIKEKCFQHTPELAVLDLRSNQITSIDKNTFYGLDNLVQLVLSDNMISTIKGHSFSTLLNLKELDLSKNTLTTLHEQMFSGKVENSLKILNLEHNHLSEFPEGALSLLSGLSNLNLGHNSVHRLSERHLSNLHSLNSLSLRECGLHHISDEAFADLDLLETLDISHNRLSDIPTVALAHLKSLENLYIGANFIPSLGPTDLRELRKLKHFSMINCQGSSLRLDYGVFKHNTELVSIDLSKCNLNNIDDNIVLDYLTMLKSVKLHGNPITTLNENLLIFSDLDSLDVSNCKLKCDCSISWLRRLLESKPEISPEARCEYYGDRKVLETDEEAFSCDPVDNTFLILSIVGIVTVVLLSAGIAWLVWRTSVCDTCFMGRYYRVKARRIPASFTGKNDIEVVPNKVEDVNGMFIDLSSLRQTKEDTTNQNSEETDPIYCEIPPEVTNFPDVKVSQL